MDPCPTAGCRKEKDHTGRHRFMVTKAEEAAMTEETMDPRLAHDLGDDFIVSTEMTDDEAREVIVRTPAEELVPDATPEGITTERTQGQIGMFHALSQIDDGVYVAWDVCRRCHQVLARCECKQPEEPKYITAWRQEYLAKKRKAEDKATKKEQTPVQVDPPEPPLSDKVDEAIETALEAVKGVEPTDVGEPLAPTSEEETT